MGPVALVTSGGSGLGVEIVRELHKAGARVAIGDRPRTDPTRTIPPEALSVHSGVMSDPADCERVVREVVAEHGRLDHLVCLATRRGFGFDQSVARTTAEDWDRTIRAFLSGPHHLLVAALQQMLAQGSGRIVMVVPSEGGAGTTGQAAVGVAASGLITLVRRTAREVAGAGITVNAVQIGLVASPWVRDELPPDMVAQLGEAVPAGRLADPTEVARAIGFLCAPEAGYITGQVLSVDGGLST